MMQGQDGVGLRGWLLGFAAVAITMVVLDVAWLGSFAAGFYREALGPLLRVPANITAAALFYVMYVGFITTFAVLPARSLREALLRGATLGFFAYATYELTNWAVIAGWPRELVIVDILWGVFLTATACAAGYLALSHLRPGK